MRPTLLGLALSFAWSAFGQLLPPLDVNSDIICFKDGQTYFRLKTGSAKAVPHSNTFQNVIEGTVPSP